MRTIKEVQDDMDAYKGRKTLRAYRQLKDELKSLKEAQIGLGDVVESITKATGIKAIVDALPFDCGCEERKQEWNKITIESITKIFRKKNVVREISVEDYAILCDMFKDGMPNLVTKEMQRDAHRVYKSAFNITKEGTSCAPCLKGTIKELYDLYILNSK
tara:strand:- start:406 stop:885 length:480 start_codon:yes stop_codon:yes gene_type:complete